MAPQGDLLWKPNRRLKVISTKNQTAADQSQKDAKKWGTDAGYWYGPIIISIIRSSGILSLINGASWGSLNQ